ncbi:hypothetical protein C7974DRAFT_77136 [Boeremia exigua]|uniref:uncharacterized protein n=1 Tax=Boeremia exigua TaxID=749465 RepID=UPI001E8D878B|nr:uncharacterized protein C7974DRAFT_77136 [Boeremia exigua]KAH6613219.1 hypothetical protein C7974DRAFT_77136 [Boeremia exigua]
MTLLQALTASCSAWLNYGGSDLCHNLDSHRTLRIKKESLSVTSCFKVILADTDKVRCYECRTVAGSARYTARMLNAAGGPALTSAYLGAGHPCWRIHHKRSPGPLHLTPVSHLQLTSPCSAQMSRMTDAAERICTIEVRCPCKKSFEDAMAYLQHKEHCTTHLEKRNVTHKPSSINRSTTIVPATAPIPAPSQKPAVSMSDTVSNRSLAFPEHGCCPATWERQMNMPSALSDPGRVMELELNAASASTAGEYLISPAETMKTTIRCPCGQSFAKEKLLNKHLQYSKTHLTGKPRSEPRFKITTPGSVPFKALHLPPTSVPPAYTSVPGMIPSSILSIVPSARNEPVDDSLLYSLASLNLDSVSTRARPLEASLVCMCGRTFTDQETLEKHKRDARRLAWQGKRETTVKVFNTPRPQYHKDEYLQDMSIALARQHAVGD